MLSLAEDNAENDVWIAAREDEFTSIRRKYIKLKKKKNDGEKMGLPLPKLEMPTFSGKIREYKLFKWMFQKTVEKNLNTDAKNVSHCGQF